MAYTTAFYTNNARATADSWLCSGNSYTACTSKGYTDHGFGANYTNSYWSAYPGHNCTNYVAFVEQTVNGAPTPAGALGNGSDWDDYAIAHSIPMDHSPAVGAVAQWNVHSPSKPFGHVAYIEAVNSDNSITVSQDNYDVGPFSWQTIMSGSPNWPDNIIHFKDMAPVVPPATDTDGDGVTDQNDWCPLVKGPATNHGCPNSVLQVSGDLNGDAKDDVIAISRGPNNEPGISWFQGTGSATPSLAEPIGLLSLPAPGWNMDNLKWVSGDFNGDGKTDLFAASGGANGQVVMYMFLSTGTGLSGPTLVKQPPYPSWQWSRLEFFSGDFNGDGKDDVIAVSRGTSNEPGISWFMSTASGTTAALADPVGLKAMPAPGWNVDNLKWVVGDFNGDGKKDLAAVSGSQVDGPVIYIFKSTGTTLDDPVLVKQPNPSSWRWDRLTFLGGDLNGDGKTDLYAVSRGTDNAPAIHWFQSTSTTSVLSLADPIFLKSAAAPAWNVGNLKFATVDNNGDGKDDLLAVSGGPTGAVVMYVFSANGTGASSGFDDQLLVKQPSPQSWIWSRLQF